ncbi:MAG TPA: PEP-CTERM sorting domain-containing protein [Isosphaeraceae bacterium]|nr:PEP-CTERM sorting domain-containing protein [Isosphaeraceae bacterium]
MSQPGKTIARALAVFCLLSSAPASSHAGLWTFTEVADTSTPIPGGTGNFTGFGTPAYHNGFLAFTGTGSSNQQGVYETTLGNPISVVANTSTAVPGSTGTYTGFERPDVDTSGNVAFVATGGAVGQGVYAKLLGGSLKAVADTNTATPNFAGGTFAGFTNLGSASIDQGTVAFAGFSRTAGGAVNAGIYTGSASGGALTRVADRTTSFPYGNSSQTMIFIDRPTINNGNVIFNASTGSNGQNGIYELKGGMLTRVIDNTQNLPGGAGKFGLEGTISRGPQVSGLQNAFFSVGPPGVTGYYGTDSTGTLVTLANFATIPPGNTVPFTGLDDLSLSGSAFVFWGSSSQEPGAFFYKTFDGSIFERIIGAGDALNGKTVGQVTGGIYGFDPPITTIAFDISFTDGTSSIWVATRPSAGPSAPEPTSLLLAGIGSIGLLGLLARRRRVGGGG